MTSQAIFPPKHDYEVVAVVFDFLSQLPRGASIVSAVVTATVYTGVDSFPDLLIFGVASITGKKVRQRIRSGVAGTVYELACTIQVSDGQVLIMTGFMAILPSAFTPAPPPPAPSPPFPPPVPVPPPPSPPTGSLTVSWELPTTDADGSPIGTITDQIVYYDTVPRMGTASPYAFSTHVGNGVDTSKLIGGLTAATTYYFAVSVIAGGAESDPSVEASGTTA